MVNFISKSKHNTFIKNTFTDCFAGITYFKGENANIVTEGKGQIKQASAR